MSRRLYHHQPKEPAERLEPGVAVAVFFPGEVARLLGLRNIEYDQLRRLFVLARTLRGEPHPGRQWSRFSLADLAATEVLVALGGGRDRLLTGKHLVLGDVERACLALRDLGIENPLLEIPMIRIGRRILARVDGYVVEPTSGQLALAHVGDRLDEFLTDRLIRDRSVRAAIRAERQRLRLRRRRLVELPEEDAGSISVSLS